MANSRRVKTVADRKANTSTDTRTVITSAGGVNTGRQTVICMSEIQHGVECENCGKERYMYERCQHCGHVHWKDD